LVELYHGEMSKATNRSTQTPLQQSQCCCESSITVYKRW